MKINKFRAIANKRIERPKSLVQVNATSNEIFLYDEIGFFGITATDFISALNDTDQNQRLTVRINSPGGDITDGVAIMNNLAERDVDVQIDGFAASIASVIAMAGDSVRMAENATFMIHNPWTIVAGDAAVLRKEAATLDLFKATLVSSYQRHTDLSPDEISNLMDAETWMTAEQALEKGFITEIGSQGNAQAQLNNFDLSIFRNAPERLRTKKEEQPTNSGAGGSDDLRRYFFKLRHQQNLL